MHNSIQNDPDKDVWKILFLVHRGDMKSVCSRGQVEKGSLGSNTLQRQLRI